MKRSKRLLNYFNTAARIVIVLLLIVPVWPVNTAYAVEVTETETFDGSNGSQVTDLGIPTNTGTIAIRNDQNCCGVGGQYFLSLKDNYSGGAQATSYTFTLPHSDHNITELGFRMAGVNENYTIQYNYSDSTSDTISYNAQNTSTYEDITRTISGKYFTTFIVTVSDWSGIDTIYWKYDDGLTAGIGPPTNLATTQNLHSGAVGVTWTAPTGYANTPERYAVAFSNDNFQNSNLAVATTTDSGDTAYTFSKQYLLSTFTDLEVGDTLYFKIRSDDDTNSLYSSWTDVVTYTIPDVASGVSTLTANQDNQYVGVIFYWTQPNTGWATQTSYKLAYKDSDDTEFTYVTGISADATNYTWTDVVEDTYEFLIYACTQNDSWCHGPQNGSISVDIASTTPTTTTTTIPPSLGPPMNPAVSNVYDTGVLVDWDVANSGNRTAETYSLYYRINGTSDNTIVTGITDTEYTIPYSAITDNTYVFSIKALNATLSLESGYSTEPTLAVVNQKVLDDIAAVEAAAAAEAQAAAEAAEAAYQAELQANLAETGVLETNAEREYREATEVIVIVMEDGSEGEYTQVDVNDGTVERDNQRAANEAKYGCYVTDEAIERGDCGDIEVYDEMEDEEWDDEDWDDDEWDDNEDDIEWVEIETEDGWVEVPKDELEWMEDNEPVYEVYDEEEGWVEVSEEEFEEILEFEAEKDAKELEYLEENLELLEEFELVLTEEEMENLTEEEILEIEKEFEEFIETILEIEDYIDLVDVLVNTGVFPPSEEQKQEDLENCEDCWVIIEDFPDEGPIEVLTELEEILEEEKLTEDEIEVLTEEEYEEYKEERKDAVEAYVEELEEEILEEVLPETVTVEEYEEIKEKEVEELTEEELEIVVEVVEEIIEEVVDTEELAEVIEAEEIEILEEEELEDLSEEELEAYEEELEEVIEEFVEELETEELVVVVEQIAEVGVENLAVADEQTVKVIQAVVAEVVDVETVEELTEEEVEVVAEVLGFTEEEAQEDVKIIAEQAATDENVAEAVEEFVERAVEASEEAVSQPYTIADAVTEVQTEAFLADPIGAIIDIDIGEITVSAVGNDMTSDQKEKAQEVVVPVIIASQIASLAGSVTRMRF
jgi:hypothetical protein